MMQKTFRRALVAATAFTVAACGDSPVGVEADLSTAQVEEMMDAMSAIGAFSSPFGFSVQSLGDKVSMAVTPINETADCPNGGSVSTSGNININETTGNFTAQLTNTYNSCKATSSAGRVWTFNGDPNISQTMTFTSNQTTGAFQMTGSQNGALRFSSSQATGRCSISLNYSVSMSAQGAETGSVTGTVCGQSVNQTL